MRVIDLFAGCGGLSLGFQNAGFEIVAGFDHWESALAVYRNNFKHPAIDLDIAQINDFSIFEYYAPDIIIGGPPCQDFSSAGKRTERARANLTIKFAEIIASIKPDFFVMENVARIVTTKTLKTAINIFRFSGYGLTSRILNASLCGVPQIRKRFFLIGRLHTEDDMFSFFLDKHLAHKPLTVFEYLGNSLGIEHYYRHPRSYKRRAIFSIYEPSPTVRGVNRPIPKTYQFHSGDTLKDIQKLRPLTTIERSYLQTFPPSFKWRDVNKSDLEQLIGNAVPVKLAEFIANSLIQYKNSSNICGNLNFQQLSLFG